MLRNHPISPKTPVSLESRRRFVRNLATTGTALCAASCGLSFDAAFARSLENDADRRPIDVDLSGDPGVSDAEMEAIYEQIKTPYKYGIVLPQENGSPVDSANVFRKDGAWRMVYLCFLDNVGYVAKLAQSDDLLRWETLGVVAPFRQTGWDAWQVSPSAALVDHVWGGSYEIQKYENKYWFTYIGGAGKGYEPDPLKIGLAWTDDAAKPTEWNRLDRPIMAPEDPDARAFEKTTLYKTSVIWDKERRLGSQFVCFYNGKAVENGRAVERIGMAVSDDLVDWRRFGNGPVVDNGSGISGDPQVVRLGDYWVMFYFGAFWKPKAFDTFAVSKDLVHWRRWEGPHLVEPSEDYDATFAHKPWVVCRDGVVYHYYNAVGSQGRCLALATSKPLK